MPWLLGEAREDLIVLRVKLNIVLVKVLKEFFGAKNFGYLYELVRVAVSMKEGFFPENHRSEHRAQRPHVKRVIVLLVVDQKLRSLEIS